jgi:hypothetical protein
VKIPQYRLLVGRCADVNLTKTYDTAPDGRLIKREASSINPYSWRFEAHELEQDADVASLVREISADPYASLINGLPAPWVKPGRTYRKLAALTHPAEDRSIVDGLVSHTIIDVDNMPAQGMGLGFRFDEACELVDTRLPPGLAGKRKIFVRSPSSGTKPDSINLRAICPLTEPAQLSELRTWQLGASMLPGAVIDPIQSVLGQIAFTAAPVIHGGGADPIFIDDRVIILNPDAGAGEIDVHEFDDVVRQAAERDRKVVREALALGWRYAAEKLIGASTAGGTRFYDPLSAVLGVAARSGEEVDAVAAYLLPLIKSRVLAIDPTDAQGRIAYYGRAFIAKHLSSFRQRDDVTAASINASRSRLFLQD